MFIIKDKKNKELFINLMETIKKTNSDWIELRQSKNYKVGLVLNKIFFDLKKIKFKNIVNNMKRWKLGLLKEKKYREKILIKNENSVSNYFSSEKIAIYTCIFGNYDSILEPYFVPDNCDFYIFTDHKSRYISRVIKYVQY